VPHELVRAFVGGVLDDEVHAKRVESIANAVIGITQATVLTIQVIGQGLAAALGTNPRHAIKQVDRLLSNARLDVWELFALWVPFVLAERTEALVAIDWTEFDADDHVTCALHLLTKHGRSTALVWKTIPKSSLRGQRAQVETEVIERLHEIVPSRVRVTLLADRAFGDLARYDHLAILGWDFVIRFREGILVEHGGVQRPAAAWIPRTSRTVLLRGAKVTGDAGLVGAVVCVRKPRMKQAWCLATSLRETSGPELVKLYARRFTIEETFRDQKDLRFGLGLKATHIRDCNRRDRLLFLSALAHAFLTLLGAASEAIGYDRRLKANTVKTRTHSLFRQGTLWFALLPNQPAERMAPLLAELERQVTRHDLFRRLLRVL
jgi:hypothetical protein